MKGSHSGFSEALVILAPYASNGHHQSIPASRYGLSSVSLSPGTGCTQNLDLFSRTTTDLGDGLYSFGSFSVRSIFVVTEEGVIVTDPANPAPRRRDARSHSRDHRPPRQIRGLLPPALGSRLGRADFQRRGRNLR